MAPTAYIEQKRFGNILVWNHNTELMVSWSRFQRLSDREVRIAGLISDELANFRIGMGILSGQLVVRIAELLLLPPEKVSKSINGLAPSFDTNS